MKILFALLLLLISSAYAADFEIGAGMAKFARPPNGVWHQQGFPYSFDTAHIAYTLGLAWQYDWLRLRSGYIDMGGVNSRAWATASDANYNGVNGCVGPCLPLSFYQGESRIKGLYFTAAPEMEVANNIRIFAEGGIWAYRATFTMHVPVFYGCYTCQPQSVTVSRPGDTKLSGVIGFGVRSGSLSVLLELYGSPTGPTMPTNFGNGIYVASVRYAF